MLDESMMAECKKFAGGMLFMGERIDDMSRDELISVIGFMGRQVKEDRERHAKDLEFLTGRKR